MYTEGIKIGNNTYILSEEDGSLKMAIGSDDKEEMEEYIKLENIYEDKIEERNYLREERAELYELDKKSRKANIEIAISTILLEGIFILLCAATTAIEPLIIVPAITIGAGTIFRLEVCGTKKKRKKKKNIINNEIEDINKELKEIKEKINTVKEKIKYSEIDLHEDEIIQVITEENKKTNVKMRVLKLEQSR